MVSPLATALLCGSLSVQHEAGSALADGWLTLRMPAVDAVLLVRLRAALATVLGEAVTASGGGAQQAHMRRRGGGSDGGGGLCGQRVLSVTAVLTQLLLAEAAAAS